MCDIPAGWGFKFCTISVRPSTSVKIELFLLLQKQLDIDKKFHNKDVWGRGYAPSYDKCCAELLHEFP